MDITRRCDYACRILRAAYRLGEEYLLPMREPLSYPDGFSVLAVKNVTGQWNGVRRQAIIFGACFAPHWVNRWLIS